MLTELSIFFYIKHTIFSELQFIKISLCYTWEDGNPNLSDLNLEIYEKTSSKTFSSQNFSK